MTPKRIIAAAAVAAAALVSTGVTQPAFAAAGGPGTTFGAPQAQAASTAAGLGGAATASIWKVEATVNPQGMAPNLTNSTLASVSATGPGEAWAAGDVWASGLAGNVNGQNLRVPYVLHWTGAQWVMTKVPNLGTEGSRLNGIQVLSPTDAWAAGQTQDSNGAILTLTEQYNGSAWTIVPSPDPGSLANLSDNSLDAVTTAGARDLFAVGARETPGQAVLRTLALATTQG